MMDSNMMGSKKVLHMIAFILVIIGGLNWLLVGVFSWGVANIFPVSLYVIPRIIYILVGLSALYLIVMHKKECGMCMKMGMGMDKGMGMNMDKKM